MTKKKLKQIFFPLFNSFLFIFFISCGFGFDSPLSTFDAQGPVAQIQKDLFLFVFWLAVVVFILVEGAILYASYKYRQKDEKLHAQTQDKKK
jgi:heme/copper-type cytochrome/quinol oxidase subunit 2